MSKHGRELMSTRMSETEKEQWENLYQYVKKEILMYDDSQSIPSNLILRLKGLSKGKYMENKSHKDKADYSYEIILYAFQISKPTILSAIKGKTFDTEMQKFNYICKIVENNINDVYIRLNNVKASVKKTQNIDTKIFENKGSKYSKKTVDNTNPKLKDLW